MLSPPQHPVQGVGGLIDQRFGPVNYMEDCSILPSPPNAFGLLGSEAKAVASGEQAVSSLSPAMVLKNGKPILTLGALSPRAKGSPIHERGL